jgi:hypothetical protein
MQACACSGAIFFVPPLALPAGWLVDDIPLLKTLPRLLFSICISIANCSVLNYLSNYAATSRLVACFTFSAGFVSTIFES